jgi:hypothetical protein
VADCCCGTLCERKNACSRCADDEKDVCSHLEPSSEVVPFSPDLDAVPPPLILPLVVIEPPPAAGGAVAFVDSGHDPPLRLHLALSVLRI